MWTDVPLTIVFCPRDNNWSPWCICNARHKPIVHTMVLRSIAWPNRKRCWPSKMPKIVMVPVWNSMAHSCLSANNSVWDLAIATHTIPCPWSWNANNYGKIIKAGKAHRGALTLLTNVTGSKSSRTTGKEVQRGSKISSTFLSKEGGTVENVAAKVYGGVRLVPSHQGWWE